MTQLSPITGFLERIASLDDTDLIEVLYGDFVRKVFQGYRVTVTPGRPTPGATPVPQLVELDSDGGRYGRVRLYDDLVVISGPPGSLRQEHLEWLRSLRKSTQARIDHLLALLDTDELTGLGSERRFHSFIGSLGRKERWAGWLMCLVLVPEEGSSPDLEQVEGILRKVAAFLDQQSPSGSHLYRMSNGFFAGLVPNLTAEQGATLVSRLQQGLAELRLPGVASLQSFASSAALEGGKRMSIHFYQTLLESLQQGGEGKRLTLSDLRRVRAAGAPQTSSRPRRTRGKK